MTHMGNPEAVRRALASSDFDAIATVEPFNVAYSAGTLIETHISIADRLAMVVWPKGGEPTYIVCQVEEPQARAESWIKDLRTYVEFHMSPITILADVLREKGLSKGRIGIETGYLHARFWEDLKRELPGATFVACERFFDQVRLVKTEREIALLSEAGVATERALLATYCTIRPGETEKSMKKRLIDNIMLCGADGITFTYINAGPNTGQAHKLSGAYQCQSGDVVKTDTGGHWSHYLSDVARTGVVGGPTPAQADIWARLWEVHVATIDMLRPGNTPAQVFETMQIGMEKAKLHFPLPHAGHSIGMVGHEWPMLNAFNHDPIPANSMFMVETRVRWPGKEGYHVEDLVLVTDEGPRWVTGTVFPNEKLFHI